VSRPARVLYYNWVDYLDDENRGGGVTVYQRNLLAALAGRQDIAPAFLSSGISYDLRARAPRWTRVRHGPQGRAAGPVPRYEIVNSGVLSPAHHSFGNPAQVAHPPTAEAFFAFLAATGPWDVVHFNNLEGLPAEVLDLKARFPETRVVLSLHNYYPVCPQVNLWQREAVNCTDFQAGAACVDCLPYRHTESFMRLANAMAFRLKCAGIRPGTRAFDLAFRTAMRLGSRSVRALSILRRQRRGGGTALPLAARAPAAAYAARRQAIVAAINAGCDDVLAVSDRVREVAARHGIDTGLLRTSYIGSPQADAWARSAPRARLLRDDGTLGLGYLGYMRRDKGFYFLLDALEALPAAKAARLRLTVAARRGPPEVMARLEALRPRLAGLDWRDGYDHGQLDALLAGVDLGLVPVLWQDNLPQVAIEMHARHIPLLTSDLGGAPELGRCPALVFRAGDRDGFAAALDRVLAGAVDLEAYWRGARPPQPMAAHVAELMRLYAGDPGPG
jgi:glycosyltransferase involved in cell wall biosynthesis